MRTAIHAASWRRGCWRWPRRGPRPERELAHRNGEGHERGSAAGGDGDRGQPHPVGHADRPDRSAGDLRVRPAPARDLRAQGRAQRVQDRRAEQRDPPDQVRDQRGRAGPRRRQHDGDGDRRSGRRPPADPDGIGGALRPRHQQAAPRRGPQRAQHRRPVQDHPRRHRRHHPDDLHGAERRRQLQHQRHARQPARIHRGRRHQPEPRQQHRRPRQHQPGRGGGGQDPDLELPGGVRPRRRRVHRPHHARRHQRVPRGRPLLPPPRELQREQLLQQRQQPAAAVLPLRLLRLGLRRAGPLPRQQGRPQGVLLRGPGVLPAGDAEPEPVTHPRPHHGRARGQLLRHAGRQRPAGGHPRSPDRTSVPGQRDPVRPLRSRHAGTDERLPAAQRAGRRFALQLHVPAPARHPAARGHPARGLADRVRARG